MGLLQKMGVGKGHMSRNKDLGPNWALWRKWVSERGHWVEKMDFQPSSGCTEGK